MKKINILYITLIISLLCGSVFSQQFKGGALLGLTGAQLDGDRYSGYNKAGLQAGFLINRELSNFFDWQIELKYIQKGAQKRTTTTDPTVYKVALQYIEMPVLLLYNLNGRITFELGPSVGYLFSAKNDLGNGKENPSIPFKKYDLNANAGMYYHINDNWMANARFAYSLVPIRGATGLPQYYFQGGQFNHLLSFSIIYQFNLAQ